MNGTVCLYALSILPITTNSTHDSTVFSLHSYLQLHVAANYIRKTVQMLVRTMNVER